MNAILKLFDLLPGWCWALICAALLLTAGVERARGQHARTQLAEVKAQIATERAAAAEAARKAEQEARATETAWREAEDTARKAKDDEIQALNARVADLDERLRKRPSRPAASAGGKTETPPTCQGGTGAGLYREDGLFLAGEAAAAARIARERDYCFARYEETR